jgi:DNA-binding GntR family transcriptional regulator
VARSASDKLEPLGRQAYRVLRRAIREGVIQSDRRYSEPELAELLGVSRTPVREALKALERDGAVERASARGYRLRSFSEEEVAELIQLRKLLERFSVSKLATQASDDDVARLDELVDRQERGDVTSEIFALDEDFHLLIAELAGLPRTREMLLALRSAMAIISAGAWMPEERTRKVIREHRGLVRAIRAREPNRAADLMEEHVEKATRALIESARRRRSGRQSLRLVPG